MELFFFSHWDKGYLLADNFFNDINSKMGVNFSISTWSQTILSIDADICVQ